MMKTQIEDAALTRILLRLGVPFEQLNNVLAQIHVDRREWSEDVANATQCVGQFVYFAPSEAIPVATPPSHLGLWASHESMPGGADFVLFLASGVPKVLEIGFFGYPMPKAILGANVSNFVFAPNDTGRE
jgi:hypothetical protein